MNMVYSPVSSWRLGGLLGVDLICSPKKICSFECVYCQLQETEEHTIRRRNFISIDKLEGRLTDALVKTSPDVMTLSGIGETTLAKNMNKTIEKRKKIAQIYTNLLSNVKNIDILPLIRKATYSHYIIGVKNRNSFIKKMQKKEIQSDFVFPYAVGNLKIFEKYSSEKYPNSITASKVVINFPLYADSLQNQENIKNIAQSVKAMHLILGREP